MTIPPVLRFVLASSMLVLPNYFFGLRNDLANLSVDNSVHSVMESLTFLPPSPTKETTSNDNDAEFLLEMENERTRVSHPLRFFYMYEEELQGDAPTSRPKHRQHRSELVAEVQILDALRKHPQRTMNPEHADMFVVPLRRQEEEEEQTFFPSPQQILERLTESPVFQKHGGNRHVVISLTRQSVFDYEIQREELFRKLENVTVVREMDATRIAQSATKWDKSDFAPLLRSIKPVTHSAFGLGRYAGLSRVPFAEATWSRFLKASHLLFYHTPDRSFSHGSTPFRKAPLQDSVLRAFLTDSVLISSSATLPDDGYQNARFCLVVRGDGPQTSALLRSIKAGCIPVVVSDEYTNVAPTPLASTLSMEDYALVIPESIFLSKPAESLSSIVHHMSDDAIRLKLRALRIVQRLVLYDHPQESLFVPTFLKEAHRAMEHPHPELNAVLHNGQQHDASHAMTRPAGAVDLSAAARWISSY